MDKKRIEIIVTAILAVVFLLVWANTFRVIKKKGPAVKSAAQVIASQPQNVLANQSPKPAIEQKPADEDKMEWARDPFSGRAYAKEGAQTKDLRLAGILWDSVKPSAIINDKIVGVGDTIFGNLVVAINPDRVILNDGLNNFELSVE
jgi:hypothetical protein